MKKLTLLFIMYSILAQAQITFYNNSTISNFNTIGGHYYEIPNFPLNNPRTSFSGPVNDDFLWFVYSFGGNRNRGGYMTTNLRGDNMELGFRTKNVRKFRAFISPLDVNGNPVSGSLNVLVHTNLGNQQTITVTDVLPTVAFSVSGVNEYIDYIVCTPDINQYCGITSVMIGDDIPQNVALSLDGIDDFVQIPNTVGNFSNQAFTVSCWIKPSLTQNITALNTDNDILEKWSQSGSYPFVIRYLNSNNGTDEGKIRIARWDGTNNPSVTSTIKVNDNKWHHVAMVRSSNSSASITLYIDGQNQGSTSDNTNGSTTNTSPLFIGRRGNGINHFRGEIDEVRIWNTEKSATEIKNEMFCKNISPSNLLANYTFNDGKPNGNNTSYTFAKCLVNNTSNAGTLNNFAKSGDVSNFVLGQVRYVNANATGTNNGSSWANAYTNLQNALSAEGCNDLVEIWVAKGTYNPASIDRTISFQIGSGMSVYGGFSGTEKHLYERQNSLIHNVNKTILSGDLSGNDTPFNYTLNRSDNSGRVVKVPLNINNASIEGFTVRGGDVGIHVFGLNNLNTSIKNIRFIDNANEGIQIANVTNTRISNCSILGNNNNGISINNTNSTNENSTVEINNSLIANNAGNGLLVKQTAAINVNNSTIVSNGANGFNNNTISSITNTIKNTIVMYNFGGGIINSGTGTTTNATSFSLIQGISGGTNGNLNGLTINPNFMIVIDNSARSDIGDYRLKYCSPLIAAGTTSGAELRDIDLKIRAFNTNDIGAYKFEFTDQNSISGIINFSTYNVESEGTITSDAKILAPAGAIDFKAPNAIILNPGFEARGVGQYFRAEIGANVGCVNP